MEHDPHRNRPPVPPAPAAPPTPDRAHWTPSKQRIFLAALLETGSVAHAARAAGMSRQSAHRLRRRLAGTPFDRTWTQVVSTHAMRLADPFGTHTVAPASPSGRPPVTGGARS